MAPIGKEKGGETDQLGGGLFSQSGVVREEDSQIKDVGGVALGGVVWF